MKQRFAALIYREAESNPDSFAFYAVVPALPGCFTAGDSYDEVLSRLPEAISLYLKESHGTPVDIVDEPPHLVVVEVALPVAATEPVIVGS